MCLHPGYRNTGMLIAVESNRDIRLASDLVHDVCLVGDINS